LCFLFIHSAESGFCPGGALVRSCPQFVLLVYHFSVERWRITLVAGGFGSSVLRVHVCAHQVLDKMLELLYRF
jgi:hypothetical protein